MMLFHSPFFIVDPTVWPLLFLMMPFAILDLVLRGIGLWRAARLGKLGWFIALLIVNSLGILPTIFLVVTKKEHRKKHGKKK